MPEPPPRQREELPVVGHPQQDLRHRERDQLAVGQRGWTPRPAPARAEKVIDLDIESDDEGVESGGHTRPPGRRCLNTANFGALNPPQLFRINHLAGHKRDFSYRGTTTANPIWTPGVSAD